MYQSGELKAFIGPQKEEVYKAVAEKYGVFISDNLVREVSPYYVYGDDAKYVASSLTKARETIRAGRIDKTGALAEEAFRKEFQDEINHLEHDRRQSHYGIMLVILDALEFRDVNNTQGHPAGDELLRGIVRVLEAVARVNEGDKIARFGGDEFALELRYDRGVVTQEEFLMLIEGRLNRIDISATKHFRGLRWNHAFYEPGMTPEDLYSMADVKGANKENGLVRSHDQTAEKNEQALKRRLAA